MGNAYKNSGINLNGKEHLGDLNQRYGSNVAVNLRERWYGTQFIQYWVRVQWGTYVNMEMKCRVHYTQGIS